LPASGAANRSQHPGLTAFLLVYGFYAEKNSEAIGSSLSNYVDLGKITDAIGRCRVWAMPTRWENVSGAMRLWLDPNALATVGA